ncbi:MAG: hypothetical protein FWD69_10510 [Polyangiaceae bacterium]|nr:hypothetical protein [Polyangiaceae bacterium]
MDSKEKIEELEAKRAQRLAELDQQELDQRILDLEARETVEEEHGLVGAVNVTRFSPGFPTCAYVRTPTAAEYKRFVDQVGKAVEKKSSTTQRSASELLANSCWVYPNTPEERKAMLQEFPGLLTTLAIAATALAEGKAEEEGKG